MCCVVFCVFFFFKQKTAYEMRISDWSSDVCSSDLESIVVKGDGTRSAFAGLVNTTDIFGPGGDFTSVLRDFNFGNRKRTQQVASAYVAGDTSDFFAGWAGPIGFTAGYEFLRETGRFVYGADLGPSFNQGPESAPLVPPFVKVNELFGELIVPLLSALPLVQKLPVEGAYRRHWDEKPVGADRRYDTNKLGINWIVSDDLRLRGTRSEEHTSELQSLIRIPYAAFSLKKYQ